MNLPLPLTITLVYLLIPARIRRLWSFGSSSSYLVLLDPTWATFRAAVRLTRVQTNEGPVNQWGQAH